MCVCVDGVWVCVKVCRCVGVKVWVLAGQGVDQPLVESDAYGVGAWCVGVGVGVWGGGAQPLAESDAYGLKPAQAREGVGVTPLAASREPVACVFKPDSIRG